MGIVVDKFAKLNQLYSILHVFPHKSMNVRNCALTSLKLHLFICLFVSSAVSSNSFAQASLDARTRDVLIEKLTNVNLNLAPNDPSKVSITLRLADLHAERARLQAMEELNSGCTKCTAGIQDRAKAITLYKDALNNVPNSNLGKVLTQLGHLFEMTGNEREAITTYERIVKESKSKESIAEAHLSLGEIYFKHRDYAKARESFKKVIDVPTASSRGLAAYRIAWCDFNNGKLEDAIADVVSLLRSPELLTRSANAEVVQTDVQFQEEVSRDLATFYSRRTPVADKDAEILFELSPDKAKLPNVTYFANEAERLGQVKPAIAIWRFVQTRHTKPLARLETHIHLANLEMELRQLAESTKDFEQALSLWSNLPACRDGDCKEIKARIRKFVLDWNLSEKSKPSEQLLAAYQGYTKTFPNESDMQNWAGKVAQSLATPQYVLAIEYYQKAAELSFQSFAQSKIKDDLERGENSLLGAIVAAELAKDAKLQKAVYEKYLALSVEKKKQIEVQYQLAHLSYDRGEYAAAAEALKLIALSKDQSQPEIKKQAADLSLDALVLLKDDRKLESWSAEYAVAFANLALGSKDGKNVNASAEFSKISRKAVLTQSTEVGSEAGVAGLEKAWATLSRFDSASASSDEKITYFKNRLILAEKLQKFREARDAAETLLRLTGLSQEDRDFALARQAWLAELNLDFGTALVATEKLNLKDGNQRWLKLAMYAELAAKDPKPYYGQFLKESKDEEKNAAIAAQFVKEAKDPLKEIEKNRSVLAKRPMVLGGLYLDAFASASTPNSAHDIAKKALSHSEIANSPAGRVMSRAVFIDDVSKMRAKIVAHELSSKNQKQMAQTLKARIQMLEEIEKFASKAVSSGDWTSQLVVLDLLSKQSERFYQEILSLPVPQGLAAEEEQQYLQLLSQQAAPHQTRATDISKKVEEFWKNEKALPDLQAGMKSEVGARRLLLVKEINELKVVAPEVKKSELAAIAALPEAKIEVPTLAAIETARQAVRESPLDKLKLEALLSLERKLGKVSMIAYLEGRIQSLQSESEVKKGN